MKAAIICVTAIASILTSASGTALLALSSDTALPAVTCAPGMRGCATTQPRTEEPQNVSKDNHPCDWVETCQLPCGREGGDCCHAEWNCPPDANLPRC